MLNDFETLYEQVQKLQSNIGKDNKSHRSNKNLLIQRLEEVKSFENKLQNLRNEFNKINKNIRHN